MRPSRDEVRRCLRRADFAVLESEALEALSTEGDSAEETEIYEVEQVLDLDFIFCLPERRYV